jgi:hypothetical protein
MSSAFARFAPLVGAVLLALPVGIGAQSGIVVQQHTTFNVAKITNADLQQTMSILGTDRSKTVTTGKTKVLFISSDASGTEITRLDQDQTIRINDKKKTYTVRSLAEERADLAKQQQEAAKSADVKEKDDVRYYAVLDEARRTGKKEVINGFSTEQAMIRITVYAENTKTKEKAVTFHITADLWFDPSQAEAARVSQAFATAHVKALGIDPLMASNPYARWLDNVHVEMAKMSGYPIRSTITFEGVADTSSAAKKDDAPPPTSIGGAVMGGLFGKKKSEPPPASPNGGPVVFTATTEVLAISTKAPAASEFEVPAGYVKK